jgi:tripartite-type tricarboxylate transporter receptor subunit TctC
MIEAGVPGYDSGVWWAVLAPKGTPEAIVARLNQELGRIVKLPDVQEKYASLGISPEHSTPSYVLERARAEGPRIATALKAAGIEPE